MCLEKPETSGFQGYSIFNLPFTLKNRCGDPAQALILCLCKGVYTYNYEIINGLPLAIESARNKKMVTITTTVNL